MVRAWEAEADAIQQQKARGIKRRVWKRRFIACASLLLAVYCSLLGSWLHYSGQFSRAADGLAVQWSAWVQHSGLTPKRVSIAGLEQLAAEQIIEQAGINPDQLIIGQSVSAMQARLLAHPQIAKASVTRILPDRIEITITESRPIAIWQHQGQQLWLNASGAILQPDALAQQQAASMLIVTGDGADKALPQLTKLLEGAPDIAAQLRAAQWVGGRRWNLWLAGEVQVMLPAHKPELALHQLAQWQRDETVLQRSVARIDLRSTHAAYVQLVDESTQMPSLDAPNHGINARKREAI
jgi:cell division protein FtsQ